MIDINIQKILSDFAQTAYSFIISHGIKIIGIIIVACIIKIIGKVTSEKAIRKIIVSDSFTSKESEEKRENTIIRTFNGALGVIIWVIAAMMILSEFGIDIGPILAAAGVAGLAFGFGGQYLIRDVIAGLFIIMENQYRVGDIVCLGDKCGLVEDITLRMTILRDLDGTVHHVPNGEIKTASNMSKEFARVNLNIGISYKSDLEHVIEIVNKVGQELANDSKWKDIIIKPPQFLRLDNFADSAIIIKILGETKPLKQWDVAGELRKRIKIAFDKENIEIPYPQITVNQK